MTPAELAKAELERASAGLESVTARRAVYSATQALSEFESSLALLAWERDRVFRVAELRLEREKQAAAESAQRAAERAEADRERAARRIEKLERDRKIAGAR